MLSRCLLALGLSVSISEYAHWPALRPFCCQAFPRPEIASPPSRSNSELPGRRSSRLLENPACSATSYLHQRCDTVQSTLQLFFPYASNATSEFIDDEFDISGSEDHFKRSIKVASMKRNGRSRYYERLQEGRKKKSPPRNGLRSTGSTSQQGSGE